VIRENQLTDTAGGWETLYYLNEGALSRREILIGGSTKKRAVLRGKVFFSFNLCWKGRAEGFSDCPARKGKKGRIIVQEGGGRR